MNTIWKITSKVTGNRKNMTPAVFIIINMGVSIAIGVLGWLCLVPLHGIDYEWLLCFAGYPGMTMGLFCGIIYLMRRE